MSSSPGLNGYVGRRGLCWIVSMAAGLSAAGGTGPPPAVFAAVGSPAAEASFDASIVGVHLYPEERILRGENAIQQYLLMGTLSDGSRKDLTAQASFSLSDPNVARPQEGGRIVAVADGETEVTAVLGTHEAKARLRVEDSNRTRPFHFARDVLPVLTRRGCNQTECHSGLKGRGGFKLSMNGSHPRQDYEWIVQGGMYQVLTDEPGERESPGSIWTGPRRAFCCRSPPCRSPMSAGR